MPMNSSCDIEYIRAFNNQSQMQGILKKYRDENEIAQLSF